MATNDREVLLEAKGVVRRYAGNVALKHVDFTLYKNQVHVLIGENGAGKSTLMRILAGVESMDEGEICLDGKPVKIDSPRAAKANGIAIVHQELSVLPNLDVSENIFAGRELLKAKTIVNKQAQDSSSTAALNKLQSPLPVARKVQHLSLGSRQIVELARTLAHGARILILDEPTSALSVTETEFLFKVIQELKTAGVTIVYISHRLHELLYLGDFFTVLRSGKVVGECSKASVTREWIVERMSGRSNIFDCSRKAPGGSTPVVMNVSHLSVTASTAGDRSGAGVRDVSFHLLKGEILGIYGLLGAGRTELLEALIGDRRMTAGEVAINGVKVKLNSVIAAMNAGIVLVPEDRQRDGLIPELSIRENVALAGSDTAVLHRGQETTRVKALADTLHIAARDLELPVTALSGGNQQKVLLARCLMRSPLVLLMDEPTRGVDVGAKAEIYHSLRKLAEAGLSVLFTSSEIEETRALADRVLVMCRGQFSAEFKATEISDEALFSAASPDFQESKSEEVRGAIA